VATSNVLALFGDSILDNAPYTAAEPDTTSHLQTMLGEKWTVRRYARDGAVMRDVSRQLKESTERPSIAVLSVGGNDLTPRIDILEKRVSSSGEVFDELDKIVDNFDREYAGVAESVRNKADRTILCTIYEVRLEPAAFARRVRIPLAAVNDRIIRTAARLGVEVLELRRVCTEPADFALQIEPSARGAEKIAHAIASVVRGDADLATTRIYG
jgi:lysophospholipase L1-like esterase